MLKPIAKLIAALNGNLSRGAIAAGFSWGVLLGLYPAGNAIWFILFAVSFFFRHHHFSKMLALAILKIFGQAIAPLIDTVGWEVLHIEALQGIFTSLYNMPFVPLTRFNNTLVAGGLVSGIVLWLPVYFLAVLLVGVYRNHISPKVKNSKLVKSIQSLPIVKLIVNAVNTAAEAS